MRPFEIPVRAVRGLLSIALLSAVACGGKSSESNGLGQGSAGNSAGGASGVAGSAAGGSGDAMSSAGIDAGIFDADIYGCTSNTDCQIVPRGCCSCGSGPLSSYIALNAIGIRGLSCGTVACAPCGPTTAPDPNDPALYYLATCQAGRCAVVDLRATDVTACQVASDCSLRAGTGCCGGCGGGLPVAINSSQEPALEQEVCGNEPTACNGCAPVFSGYDATCSDGRCSVELAVGPPPCPCPD